MYKVVQVLNNNVAVVKSKENEQAIAMGKGIVFNKKKGDLIQEKGIEKLFCLQSKESQKNFVMLLDDIPLDFITTTYEIIELGKVLYHLNVQDYIYVTLAGHIYWGYKRLIDNNYNKSLVPDMSQDFPDEYAVAKGALDIINKNLHIDFPKEEIKSIALHFINARGDTENSQVLVKNNTELLTLVTEILEKHNILRNETNRNFYDRLMIHLKYFIERIDNQDKNESTIARDTISQLYELYPYSGVIVDEISKKFSNKEPSITLNLSEKLYLIIHIQRLVQEKPRK